MLRICSQRRGLQSYLFAFFEASPGWSPGCPWTGSKAHPTSIQYPEYKSSHPNASPGTQIQVQAPQIPVQILNMYMSKHHKYIFLGCISLYLSLSLYIYTPVYCFKKCKFPKMPDSPGTNILKYAYEPFSCVKSDHKRQT